jgi:hypothetical protein
MLPILFALAFIIFLIGVIVSGRPDEFTVSRSIRVSASPDRVFSRVNELRKWEDWSPWAKLDPHATSTFDGPAAGDGAAMSWDGNKKVGAGRMTIVASRPSDMIRIRLEFLRPFKATNMAEFDFHSEDAQTVVTWSMSGKNNLFFKAFSLFVNCDDMVGKDFEKGLASLKVFAEE